jgi:hypothetical protein
MNYYKGKFTPKNPNKYEGDPTQIYYRSSWELRVMNWFDNNPNVIGWSSEEIVVPYRCGTDNKIHRYFPDFKIKVRTSNGCIKTYLIEVKPYGQTEPPKFPGKQTRRYITESMTFIKNQSKWKAAEQYSKAMGWEFKIITEKDIF